MSLEIISWIVAFFLVWEGSYIFLLKTRANETRMWRQKSWLETKTDSLLFAFMTIASQFFIVFFPDLESNYFRLIWEAGIVLAVGTFLYVNKKIADWIK